MSSKIEFLDYMVILISILANKFSRISSLRCELRKLLRNITNLSGYRGYNM